MTRKQALASAVPIAVGVALLGALLVLTAGLDELTLAPSRPASQVVASSDEAQGPSADGDPSFGFGLVRHLLFVAFTVSLAVVLVGALLTRFLRRWLYFAIGLFGALIVFDFFVAQLPSGPSLESDGPTAVRVAVAAEEPRPSEWSRTLIAVGLSLGASAVVVVSSSWIVTRWRSYRSHQHRQGLIWELEALADTALSTGADENSVLRCYREMVHLLSRREQIDHAALTPREFSGRLRDLGLRTGAVDRLTKLFELVRYGHRDSNPFSKHALASLEAIRDDTRSAGTTC
jgi:hypothetical protein